MCTPWIDLFDGAPSIPNGYHMQKLFPREVDVSANHIGAHKHFGVSSSGLRAFYVDNFLIVALC
jgi:hypothetical protein